MMSTRKPFNRMRRGAEIVERLHVERKHERHGHDDPAARRDQRPEIHEGDVPVRDVFQDFRAQHDVVDVMRVGPRNRQTSIDGTDDRD